jgi:hypothetical protein
LDPRVKPEDDEFVGYVFDPIEPNNPAETSRMSIRFASAVILGLDPRIQTQATSYPEENPQRATETLTNMRKATQTAALPDT